uniref:Uncharacterized protein n=1 Tax=Arion vulgaris TaxID=1028688 RepID=A0A0B7B935_9EUPU
MPSTYFDQEYRVYLFVDMSDLNVCMHFIKYSLSELNNHSGLVSILMLVTI